MALPDDLKTKQQIGEQRLAEVIDTSALPKDQADGLKSQAASRWITIRQHVADAAEMQAEVVRIVLFPNTKYHSAFSKVQTDEILRLAEAEGLTGEVKFLTNDRGSRDIVIEFDIKAAIAAVDAAAALPVTP